MSQLLTGRGTNTTCHVTNGSPNVDAAAGSDWIAALAGSKFKLAGAAPIYDVSADATIVGGVWRIVLTGPYGGASNLTASYAIQKDWLSIGGISVPILAPGDDMLFLNRWASDMATALATVGISFDNFRKSPTSNNGQLLFSDGKYRDLIGVVGLDGNPRLQWGDPENE